MPIIRNRIENSDKLSQLKLEKSLQNPLNQIKLQ